MENIGIILPKLVKAVQRISLLMISSNVNNVFLLLYAIMTNNKP